MRFHDFSSMMQQTLFICMSPQMCSEMNPWLQSSYTDRCPFITDVGIFAVSVAIPCPWQLPCNAIAVSLKWIYIWGIYITIQLHVVKESPEGTYKVM